jgi:hypothetical protein
MMERKKNGLQAIYDDFENAAAPYKTEAACGKGCAFCCTDAGGIHITTLEGLVIRDRINQLPRARQVAVKKALATDIRRREQKKNSACPLLMKNRACMLYAWRPFACRRIYSLKVCSQDQHPLIHRQVMVLGDEAISEGLVIRDRINQLPRAIKNTDMKKNSACPLLICYAWRPFACRQQHCDCAVGRHRIQRTPFLHPVHAGQPCLFNPLPGRGSSPRGGNGLRQNPRDYD